jgi:hypothetical protein
MHFKLTTLVVIGTDCTGSCKCNYHAITTTMAPLILPCLYNILRCFSPVTSVSSTNKTVRHDITVILLKVALVDNLHNLDMNCKILTPHLDPIRQKRDFDNIILNITRLMPLSTILQLYRGGQFY